MSSARLPGQVFSVACLTEHLSKSPAAEDSGDRVRLRDEHAEGVVIVSDTPGVKVKPQPRSLDRFRRIVEVWNA
jgi:hypothetical protein